MDAEIDIYDVIQSSRGQSTYNAPVPSVTAILGILVPERKAKMPVQAINGRCLKCGYRFAWVLIRGRHILPQETMFSLSGSVLI